MEEQSCVLLENGRRISAFASQLPFMRGTALTPDPSIKNRQAPCGACRFLQRTVKIDIFVFGAEGAAAYKTGPVCSMPASCAGAIFSSGRSFR